MSLIDKEQFINEMNTRAEEEALDFRDIRDMVEFAPTVDAIPIPEGATNGDMIMAMFNCMVIGISNGKVYVEHIYFPFDEEWWNTPYKRGVEE